MSDALPWISLFAAGASLASIITFWVNYSRAQRERGAQEEEVRLKAEAAVNSSQIAVAKLDMLAEKFHEHDTKDAAAFGELRTLVAESTRSQTHLENRLVDSIESLGMRMDKMTDRLDRILAGGGRQ